MIYFIQPAIPKYREGFFDKLRVKYDCKFFTTEKDFLNVKTSYKNSDTIISDGFFSFFNKFFWHKKLSLFRFYSKGDIVIINGNPRILNYMLLFLMLRIRGIKTVWWGHGWTAGSFGFMAKIRIELMRLASIILVYTDKEKNKLSKPNCYALNNGLDSSEIAECIKNTPMTRYEDSSTFYLVFVGRITEKSNLDLLLSSMCIVRKNIHLNIIGSGDKIDFYKALCDELNIKGRVHWYGAVFDEMSIAKIMLSSHAFVYTGSVGLSLIHAFNYGLPAIIHSSERYHMPEFSAFNNEVNGVCFERNNLDDLRDKINELSSLDTDSYAAMSNNAFKTIRESYNSYDMVLRFSKMIEANK